MGRLGPAAECPRCGYDQSGTIAAWSGLCPLEGTCSECGLTFGWRDVLGGRFFGPNWSFEHGARARVGRWCGTAWRALVPRVMWRRLALAHRVRLGRLVLFAAVVLVVGLHVPAVAAVVWLKVRDGSWSWYDPHYDVGFGGDVVPCCLWPYGVPVRIGGDSFPAFMMPFLVLVLLPATLMAVSMLVFGQTFRRTRVRRVHIARGLAYSLPGAAAGVWVLTGTFYSVFLMGVPLSAVEDELAIIMMAEIVAVMGWLGYWWWAFVARYLRLPHAVWVAISVWVVSALGSVVVFVVIDQM